MGAAMSDHKQCAERVYDPGTVLGRPCSRRAVRHHGGKWWCAIHSPEAVEARNEKKRARWAEDEKSWRHANALRDARAEVVKQAKAWRVNSAGQPVGTFDHERYREALIGLAAAVDALLALEEGKP